MILYKKVQLNAPKLLVACLGRQLLRTEGLLSAVEGLRLSIHWDGECYGRTQALHTLGCWELWKDSGEVYTGMLRAMGGLRLSIHWDAGGYGRTQALHTLGYWELWENSS